MTLAELLSGAALGLLPEAAALLEKTLDHHGTSPYELRAEIREWQDRYRRFTGGIDALIARGYDS